MIGLALFVALVLALAASGYRLSRRRRLRSALAAVDGGSRQSAVEVEAFTEIDDHLLKRHCPCGGTLASLGERSERSGGRILRVVRVECRLCEDRREVWFDATRAFH